MLINSITLAEKTFTFVFWFSSAFGIGSMVYSGLEFGRYFELKNDGKCHSNVLQAITPATRMVLTLVQVQFIFLNSKVWKCSTITFNGDAG